LTIVEFMDYRCGYCKKRSPSRKTCERRRANRFIVRAADPGEQSMVASALAIATKIVAGDEAL